MREKFIFKKAYFTWGFELFEDVIDAITCVIEYTSIFSQLNSAIFVKNEGFSWVFWNCEGKYMWVVRRFLFNVHYRYEIGVDIIKKSENQTWIKFFIRTVILNDIAWFPLRTALRITMEKYPPPLFSSFIWSIIIFFGNGKILCTLKPILNVFCTYKRCTLS